MREGGSHEAWLLVVPASACRARATKTTCHLPIHDKHCNHAGPDLEPDGPRILRLLVHNMVQFVTSLMATCLLSRASLRTTSRRTAAGGGNICALLTSQLTWRLIYGVAMQNSVPMGCEIQAQDDTWSATLNSAVGCRGRLPSAPLAPALRRDGPVSHGARSAQSIVNLAPISSELRSCPHSIS
jgi:hypothetical protein